MLSLKNIPAELNGYSVVCKFSAGSTVSSGSAKLTVNAAPTEATTAPTEAPPETTEAFILRLKPDGAFMDITDDQKHTYYQINDSDENERVILGTWQTFTIDISSLGDKCTEFSFIIPAGGTVYFRDITIA